MNIEHIYRQRIGDPQYNTSYPLHPSDWKEFRREGALPFKAGEFSFYIHIPFCKHLCSFCEYTRMLCPDKKTQLHYVEAIENDMERFAKTHEDGLLLGFDIGGGTPTALNEEVFERLARTFSHHSERLAHTADYEPSIEATFDTLSQGKLEIIGQSGIKRLSLGVQSASDRVLESNHRQTQDIRTMEKVINMAHKCGILKINLDFMYGLKEQTEESLRHDLEVIKTLQPEQVTTYELRTNMIAETSHTTPEQRYAMYNHLYEGLTEMGYHAPFGQNTFSKEREDMGVSSYLRHRMREGCAYKGFGLSAQSLSSSGISYNIGKNSRILPSLLTLPSFEEEYTYLLPTTELASKYIAIAAYSGAFSVKRLSEILGEDARKFYKEPLDFCLGSELMSQEGDLLRITRKGFRHYGATFSLFYDYKHPNHE